MRELFTGHIFRGHRTLRGILEIAATGVGWAASTLCSGCGPSDLPATQSTQQERLEAMSCAVPCGGVLTTVDDIAVYSNSPNQGTGRHCAGRGSYGNQYGCVEFAQRFFAERGWGTPAIWAGVTSACDMCSHHPGNVVRVLTPSHGDLFVYPCSATLPFGHVALIDKVSGDQAFVFEQDWFCSGRRPVALSFASCFLHATANHDTL